MNSTKPTQTRQCTCGREFQPTARNQRYCQPCRDARAQAAEALRVKTCRRCNEEKPTHHGICAECREVARQEHNAQRESVEAKKLARFGPCKECHQPASPNGDKLCWKHSREQKRREKLSLAPRAQKSEEDSYLDEFDKLPVAVQWQHIAALIGMINEHMNGTTPRTVEEVNPEEVPAANQDDIDAAFASIMADF